MAISDYKIRSEEFSGKDIVGLPDKPSEAGITAATLKERFDAGTKKVVVPKYNNLIEELVGSGGAGNIGAAQIPGLSGYNVQDILAAVKVLLDTKQSIEQSNIDVNKKFDKTEAQALVKTIVFNEKSGVFTITKYDGTTQTIDTALEKVALNVRLDGQQFVLTLVDGTEQRVDLSAFLTQTEIKSSNTISLTEESGVIVAKLINGSVEKEHLSAATLVYLEDKESSAAASAADAAVQASNALASANAAAASQQSALECAENACRCSSDADISAQEAAASASSALSSAQNANDSAERAEQAADRAEEVVGGDFATRSDLENHVNNKENPHEVTREQIGAASAAALSTHTADTTNPHNTTAEQVGAVPAVKYGTAIPNNDANNCIIAGFYAVGSNAIANMPISSGGTLIVSPYDEGVTSQIFVSNTDKTRVFCRSKAANWLPWIELANAANFLPLDGSVAMDAGAFLFLEGKKARFLGDANRVQIESINVPNNYSNRTGIRAWNSIDRADIAKAFVFYRYADSKLNEYTIFGEHNPQLLATTIQNLIQGGSISMIKSVQRGIITIAANATEGTATLAQAVNMSKAVVLFGGSLSGNDYSGNSLYWDARLVLSANNKVNAARAYSASYTAIVPYQVLEFA